MRTFGTCLRSVAWNASPPPWLFASSCRLGTGCQTEDRVWLSSFHAHRPILLASSSLLWKSWWSVKLRTVSSSLFLYAPSAGRNLWMICASLCWALCVSTSCACFDAWSTTPSKFWALPLASPWLDPTCSSWTVASCSCRPRSLCVFLWQAPTISVCHYWTRTALDVTTPRLA